MKLQNKKAEIEFFDRFDRKGGYDVFDEKGYLKMLSWMTEFIPTQKNRYPRDESRGFFAQNKVIIDMGCGSGAFTSYLQRIYSDSK